MIENMQLWIYGTAAVIDTVLLFALIERHNWRTVTVWMVLLALGVWMWHGGIFVRQLVDQAVGPLADPVRWLAMLAMAFGLMLMPSAALHGTWRLLTHGRFQMGPRPNPRIGICYLPMGLLAPMGQSLASDPSAPFLNLLEGYHTLYGFWLCLVSGISAAGLVWISIQTPDVPLRLFYRSLAASMLLIAVLASIFIATWSRTPEIAASLQTIIGVSPILPALLFAYFVMRFQLVPLILERTLVYGAVVLGVMLFHAIVLRDAVTVFEQQFRLDLGIVEGALALMVILFYPPLRDRVAAALQSLIDSSTSRRSERRSLAVQLAARAGDSAQDLLNWFTSTMQRSFGSDLAAAWLCDREGLVLHRSGAADLIEDRCVSEISREMADSAVQFITRYSAPSRFALQTLDRIRAGALFRYEHSDVSGLFLIGCRSWGQPPNDEDLHALSLLTEQFGVTLHNSQLQLLQAAAEHRGFQQEKLSALGLLASSLAHEIKNPLSSIKTITRVLAEELGPDSPYAEDLRMIGGEIDRLATSTAELLEAARPPRADHPVPLTELLSPTLGLLMHLAREHNVTLTIQFPDQPIVLPVEQVSLREIVFNLVSNAVEAAGVRDRTSEAAHDQKAGRVQFACREESDSVVIEVQDSGPGISASQRSQIFEPFFTTKPTGTGLGLYVVARRVRELGGEIDCHCAPGQGTRFRLRLPTSNETSMMEQSMMHDSRNP
jgi:signal transduction histidine kinase